MEPLDKKFSTYEILSLKKKKTNKKKMFSSVYQREKRNDEAKSIDSLSIAFAAIKHHFVFSIILIVELYEEHQNIYRSNRLSK